MKHYRIKLNETNSAKPNQQADGYLSFDETWGKWGGCPYVYPRGEAIKKARMFGGKMEVVPHSRVIETLRMATIPENAILHEIVLLLNGQMEFKDLFRKDIYAGDVFQTLLAETENLSPKATSQLVEFVQMIDADYVMITK
jgi:hypothetical protein